MKKTYDDYYAQVRKVSGDRKIVYFWINNLLKEDFVKLENGNYCLAGDGEYNGLRVSYLSSLNRISIAIPDQCILISR